MEVIFILRSCFDPLSLSLKFDTDSTSGCWENLPLCFEVIFCGGCLPLRSTWIKAISVWSLKLKFKIWNPTCLLEFFSVWKDWTSLYQERMEKINLWQETMMREQIKVKHYLKYFTVNCRLYKQNLLAEPKVHWRLILLRKTLCH